MLFKKLIKVKSKCNHKSKDLHVKEYFQIKHSPVFWKSTKDLEEGKNQLFA